MFVTPLDEWDKEISQVYVFISKSGRIDGPSISPPKQYLWAPGFSVALLWLVEVSNFVIKCYNSIFLRFYMVLYV
jgi:hypothetical protein